MERVWLFMRKITTIVVAVAVVVFVLLQFPGINEERMAYYHAEKDKAVATFFKKIKKTPYAAKLGKDNLMPLVNYWNDYKDAKMTAGGKDAVTTINAEFQTRNALYFTIVQPEDDKTAKKVNREFKKLVKERKGILREMRKERIDTSFLGTMGKWLEPATRYAGFNCASMSPCSAPWPPRKAASPPWAPSMNRKRKARLWKIAWPKEKKVSPPCTPWPSCFSWFSIRPAWPRLSRSSCKPAPSNGCFFPSSTP